MYQAFDILDIPFEKEELINNKSEKKIIFLRKSIDISQTICYINKRTFWKGQKKDCDKKNKKMSEKLLTNKTQSDILLMHLKKSAWLRKCSLKTEQNVTLSS